MGTEGQRPHSLNSCFLNVMKIKMASTPCSHYRRKCQVKVSIPKFSFVPVSDVVFPFPNDK